MKILESREEPFYKLKTINTLKRYITGLREVEILKITYGLFTRKETDGTKKMILFGFLLAKAPDREKPSKNHFWWPPV